MKKDRSGNKSSGRVWPPGEEGCDDEPALLCMVPPALLAMGCDKDEEPAVLATAMGGLSVSLGALGSLSVCRLVRRAASGGDAY